ncbi:hypothetical protein [Saccharopolyspora hattusasensis]|uniref:hypothetical protein n=1 Tax=Saccharopolyspora hattusasensis TaxID=1128679 RepID=UPI003D95C247
MSSGALEQTGAERDDLDAWLAQAVTDKDGVQVPTGAADVEVMWGDVAYDELVATRSHEFLSQDAGDDAADAVGVGSVRGDDDFDQFLDEYGGDPTENNEWELDGSFDFDEWFAWADADLDVSRGEGSAGLRGDEWDKWSDGGVDLIGSYDDVGDPGGDGQESSRALEGPGTEGSSGPSGPTSGGT